MSRLENTNISWKCTGEKTLLDFPYLQLVERLCQPSAAPDDFVAHRFYVIQSRDWCNIIPVTEDGKVLIIRQFRAGTLETSLEFPGGIVESTDADLQATAIREMIEETGYEPIAGARCQFLGSSYPNPALQDNRLHSLIVGPVKKTKAQNLDPAEDIEVIEVPIAELPSLFTQGRFDHALMLTTLFHFLMQDPAIVAKLPENLRAFTKGA